MSPWMYCFGAVILISCLAIVKNTLKLRSKYGDNPRIEQIREQHPHAILRPLFKRNSPRQ